MGNPFDLGGALALVTGGGTGLGFGICRAIKNAGGRIVMTGRREDVLKAACVQLGEGVFYIRHDVTELASIPGLVEEIESQFGPIDILINNAGQTIKKPALETTDGEFESIITTHVFGSFALSRECGKRMIDRGRGSIIMILSMTSLMGMPLVVAYSTAKSALLGMVRTLASELSPGGVRVNGIAPGWITTPLTRKTIDADPERKRKVLARTPMGKMGEPDDVGCAAVYLSSPAAKFVTGIVLPIDGGASIGF